MDKPSKRKTLDTQDGMEDFGDGSGAAHHESARKRTSTGGSGSSRGKKAVVVENPGVVQARRDQNRIAQREFRMRKQQHIRDLEARVAILSGDRDERQEVMSLLIRNLMNENGQLRKMVKNLAGFIGEGLATCLPRLGLTEESMDAFVNRAETEAAHEAYEALKAAKRKEEQSGGPPAPTSYSNGNGSGSKKGSYEQLFGPIGGSETPNGSVAGGSKNKFSGVGDDEDDEDEEGEGDDELLEGGFDRDGETPGAALSFRPAQSGALPIGQPSTATAGASGNPMSRSSSLGFPTPNSLDHRRGTAAAPNIIRTAPVSTVHGVPLHTLDRLDSPTAGPDNVGDFSFSPYYTNQVATSSAGGNTPGGVHNSVTPVNGSLPPPPQTQGLPLQYLSSTLHELRDPLASPETSTNAEQLPSYYQPQQQLPQQQQQQQFMHQNQQQNMNMSVTQHQQPYVAQPQSQSLVTTNGSSALRPEQGEEARETFDREFERVINNTMGRKQESFQLISYHLNNFHVNPNYVLPLSLRPTQAQRTIPHEHIIDGIIFPTLRDKMILLRGKYNIFEALRGMWDAFSIMGEDTLDHNSWEVSEQWMKQNLMLVDNEVIAISNRWRLKRGEPAITRESLLVPQ
ncbi:hypothetical protein QFC21_005917 [Naganishia friedmannii]|uniref:Uncharacterized protein n=1 Tax=Naganishia friedmannii TaxID=89922 RepID=A0ACC2V6P4_9TREE|nr:hypothetical protein QFC21_005917 [Naganishia friedmannii]